MWNSLPGCIVMSNSVVACRQKLKQLHFSDFCNSLLEIHIVVYIVIIVFMLILYGSCKSSLSAFESC